MDVLNSILTIGLVLSGSNVDARRVYSVPQRRPRSPSPVDTVFDFDVGLDPPTPPPLSSRCRVHEQSPSVHATSPLTSFAEFSCGESPISRGESLPPSDVSFFGFPKPYFTHAASPLQSTSSLDLTSVTRVASRTVSPEPVDADSWVIRYRSILLSLGTFCLAR